MNMKDLRLLTIASVMMAFAACGPTQKTRPSEETPRSEEHTSELQSH